MRAAACVGRVGGLAVVLGIGAAVALGTPAAVASPGDSPTGSGTGSETNASSPARDRAAAPAASTNSRGNSVRRDGSSVPARNKHSSPAGSTTVAMSSGPGFNVGDRVSPPDIHRLGSLLESPFAAASPAAVGGGVPGAATAVDVPNGPVIRAASLQVAGPIPSVPLGGTSPVGPVGSVLAWSVLAVARRQTGAPGPATSVGRATTGELIAPAAATLAAVTAAANNPPVISGSIVISHTDSPMGLVTGTVYASDPNGDKITFKAVVPSSMGKMSMTKDGAFTYIPSAKARHAAAKVGAPTSATTGTMTVTVTDSKGAKTVRALALLPISPKNAAPTATKTVGAPNATTGVVTGKVTGADADKDRLTYSAPASTGKGTVSITSTGAFTYTPTAAARHAAARAGATPADKADTFTVTVSDGYGGSLAVPITVAISPKELPTVIVPVGKNPFGVVVSPDGRWVYTSSPGDATVSVVDTATNKVVGTINCAAPVGLALSPDGSRLYATGTRMKISDGPATKLTVIDTGTRTVLSPYEPDPVSAGLGGSIAVSPDGQKIYLQDYGNYDLGKRDAALVFDTTTKTTTTRIDIFTRGLGLSPDGNNLYLSSENDVVTFDAATGTRLWAVSVGLATQTNYYYINAIAPSPDGTRVYAMFYESSGYASERQTAVAVIDATVHNLITVVQTRASDGSRQTSHGMAVSPDGKRIYVIDPDRAFLSIIDTDTNTVIGTKQTPANPVGLSISPDGTHLYVTCWSDGTLAVIPV